MSRNTDNVIRLINAGGNLSVNCDGRNTDNVLRVIKAAQKKNTKLTLRNLDSHNTDNVIRIIKAAGDTVVLEV
ncbi:hypothetical protein [Agarivorans sp. Alg241-V36]|uniref:hypothetical protein n=1 Tax=Agarivorans sp. Alg241-V36 TaxID=2305992 RepID=UPI0013D62859|nr:hypothetical protein [Agarivorans sp. Alg241-V36]